MSNAVHAINSSEVSKDLNLNSPPAKDGSSSFDTNLKAEEKKLQERAKLSNPFSWNAVQSVLNVIPLEFDFNINIASIEKNFDSQTRDPGKDQAAANSWNTSVNSSVRQENSKGGNYISASAGGTDIGRDIVSNSPGADSLYFIPNMQALMPVERFAEALKARTLTADIDRIIESVANHVKLMKAGGKTSIELSLKQEELGDLLLNISSKNGVVSIEIVASKQAEDIMLENMEALKNALIQANINLGNLDVSTKGSHAGKEALEESAPSPLFRSAKPAEEINKILFGQASAEKLFFILNALNIYSKA